LTSLTRYVLGQLFVGMMLATVGLTSVIWLTQSLRFVDMIVNRGLPGTTFVYLTFLLLPNFLSLVLPLALFTVVLFVYSRLIGDRELVVMQGSGIGPFGIASPALLIAAGTMVVSYAINFYFLPESYRMFRELQWDIRYNYSQILLQEGAFNPVSKDVTVYVRERSPDGQLQGLLVHDNRNPKNPVTIMASRGALVEANSTPRVLMFDGNRQEIDESTHKMSVLYFDRYSFDLEPARDGANAVRFREPRERSVGELFSVENDPTVGINDYGKFRMEGHKRLISPLNNMGFTLIALGFLLAGSPSRRGVSSRIVIAAGAVVAFSVLTLAFENLSAKNGAFIPFMYLAALLPSALGATALVQPPRRRVWAS